MGIETQQLHTSKKWVNYLREDGRVNEHQIHTEWRGKGCNEFKLITGNEVRHDDFELLLEGLSPITPEKLYQRRQVLRKPNHLGESTGGWCMVLKPPKSYSIAGLVYNDQNLVKIHRAGVLSTIDEIEEEFLKVKYHQKKVQSTTGLFACFEHQLSRANDPHLHTHTVIFNLAKRPNNRWGGLQVKEVLKHLGHIEQYYHQCLKVLSHKGGYKTRDTELSFELKDIPDSLIREFSTRRQQIEKSLELYGYPSNPKTCRIASYLTRAAKDLRVDFEDLRADWLERESNYGTDTREDMKVIHTGVKL